MIDRFLYRLGLVRRSYFDELREAAENMQIEWLDYQQRVEAYVGKNPSEPPEQQKFKLIQGGKK